MADVEYFAYEDLSVGTSSIGFTATTFLGADYAQGRVEVGAIRFRLDAGTATASVGDTLEVGDRFTLESREEVARFRAIRRDGVSATVRVNFGKKR